MHTRSHSAVPGGHEFAGEGHSLTQPSPDVGIAQPLGLPGIIPTICEVPKARTRLLWRPRPESGLLNSLCVHVCLVTSVVSNSLPLCDPMYCSPPGSSVHRILQARILEWDASSRGSSQPRDQTCILTSPALAGRFFATSTTWVAHRGPHR